MTKVAKKSFIAKFVFKLLNDQNRSKGESSINFDYFLGLVNQFVLLLYWYINEYCIAGVGNTDWRVYVCSFQFPAFRHFPFCPRVVYVVKALV